MDGLRGRGNPVPALCFHVQDLAQRLCLDGPAQLSARLRDLRSGLPKNAVTSAAFPASGRGLGPAPQLQSPAPPACPLSLVDVRVLFRAFSCPNRRMFVCVGGVVGKLSPAMGTAYSDNWACSAAVWGGGSCLENDCGKVSARRCAIRSAARRLSQYLGCET